MASVFLMRKTVRDCAGNLVSLGEGEKVLWKIWGFCFILISDAWFFPLQKFKNP